MAFNYIINVTGDCQNNGSGIIDLIISGGSEPYTVQWLEPALTTNIGVFSSVTKTNLYGTTYSIQVTDSSLPTNQVEYLLDKLIELKTATNKKIFHKKSFIQALVLFLKNRLN
jgi:hypothetical protein